MFKEFKEFIMQGNVIDLAVGVVIGAAFRSVVDSIVDNVFMPLVGFIAGGIDYRTMMKFVLKPAVVSNGVETAPEVAINLGLVLQAIISFLLIAFCIFLVIKGINSLRARAKALRKQEEEAALEEKTAEVVLLEEIVDLLKQQ